MTTSLNAEQRRLRALIACHARWVRDAERRLLDHQARLAAARHAFHESKAAK